MRQSSQLSNRPRDADAAVKKKKAPISVSSDSLSKYNESMELITPKSGVNVQIRPGGRTTAKTRNNGVPGAPPRHENTAVSRQSQSSSIVGHAKHHGTPTASGLPPHGARAPRYGANMNSGAQN